VGIRGYSEEIEWVEGGASSLPDFFLCAEYIKIVGHFEVQCAALVLATAIDLQATLYVGICAKRVGQFC
jgi:hypothetical protein